MSKGHDSSLLWHSLGAHLLQVTAPTAAQLPLFYVSPLVSQFSDRPPRAGVPVMFPQFADRGPGPKHGVVRMVPWVFEDALQAPGSGVSSASVVSASSAGSSASAGSFPHEAWTLHLPPQPENHWYGHARLRVSAQVGTGAVSTLTMEFEVENLGADEFSFTGGLHPYYAVSDVTQLRIEGLDGTPFADRYGAECSVLSAFLSGQAFERLYLRSDELVMVDGARRVRMSSTGFDNWMVWNPGVELAKGLADLPDEDWQHFICIEPVSAATPVLLAPGERFVGSVVISTIAET